VPPARPGPGKKIRKLSFMKNSIVSGFMDTLENSGLEGACYPIKP